MQGRVLALGIDVVLNQALAFQGGMGMALGIALFKTGLVGLAVAGAVFLRLLASKTD